jgi:hypothetical protein
MKLVMDADRFMAWQQDLLVTLMQEIRTELVRIEAPEDVVRSLTERIAFSVTAVVDGSRSATTAQGIELNPILCFLTEEGELVHCGGSSFMHEYVGRLSGRVFDDASS